MKAKVSIEKIIDRSTNKRIKDTLELDIPESIFTKITAVNSQAKTIPMYYATLDGNVVLNYNNKKTYASEKKLLMGIKATLSNNINSYTLNMDKRAYNSYNIDFDDIVKQLMMSGRLKIHKLEVPKI